MSQTEKHLIYLVRFYDIQGYEHWGAVDVAFPENSANDIDDGSSDGSNSSLHSDDSSQQKLSLEDAVRRYPHVAVEELASRIGLVLEEIRNFQARVVQYQQLPRQAAAKQLPVEADAAKVEDVKRVRKSETFIPMHELVNARPPKSASKESSEGPLMWGVASAERAKGVVLAKMEAYKPGVTPSRGSSKESPTEVVPSQERWGLRGGSKKGSNR